MGVTVAATPGSHTNTFGSLTSSLGNSGTASDTLTFPQTSSFSVPSATGTGTVTGDISGGGPTCTMCVDLATTPAAVAGSGSPGVLLLAAARLVMSGREVQRF